MNQLRFTRCFYIKNTTVLKRPFSCTTSITLLQCVPAALKAECILGCIQSRAGSRRRRGFYLSVLVGTSLQCCIQLWGPQQRKAMDLSKQVWWRATNIITGQEHLSYENSLRWLGFFILEKIKLQEDLTEPFSTYRRLTGKKERTFYTGRQ